ncbi:MAG: Ig-like domain-containing protein [Methanobrevibacter sp.]|uniref:Ig-like domain-containing protein n=1 Tax=Methanobrevibacter sp. TaxID=66852 RepID=UPI0026DF1C1E|nr:Ig-like domain-containing protein [Methanobrevibacter sp.]MDO5847937.1 Ig-like domain-containing protein [Methanobrevibacter sp.]
MIKKVMVLLTILIFVFSVSAISAEDNNDLNYSDLQSSIDQSGDSIDLTSDYTRAEGEKWVTINKNITINGNDHTIDGNGYYVFDIPKNTVVIFNNIKFINSLRPIDNAGTVILNDCTFNDNNGAVNCYAGSTLEINNCIFTNNGRVATNAMGGAISITNAKVTISNSQFTNNVVNYNGTNPDYNSGFGFGGAIFAKGSNSILDIDNSNFNDNFAYANNNNSKGGAIMLYDGAKLSLKNSNFNGNVAVDGGAIYVAPNSVLTVNDTHFQDNSAINSDINKGGAICSEGSVDIDNSLFMGNEAVKGGAIYATNGNINISATGFDSNSGNENVNEAFGGAICLDSNVVANINDCSFLVNSANNGGAIFAGSNNNVNISKNSFLSNSANNGGDSLLGGAICLGEDNNVTVADSTFRFNNAGAYGGAIFNEGNLTLINSTFIRNNAGVEGSIFSYGSNSELNLHNVTADAKNIVNNYNNVTENVTFITKTAIDGISENSANEIIVNGTVSPTATGNLTIELTNMETGEIINDVGTVDNGQFTVNLGQITAGNYSIVVKFDENRNYTSSQAKSSFTITGVPVELESSDVVKYYNNGTQLAVNLTNENGVPIANQTIVLTVDGMDYSNITNSNGTAKFDLNMGPGNYTGEISYYGSGIYEPANITVNIEILSRIIANDINMMYKDGTRYNVTVLDEQGNVIAGETVTVILNGQYFKNLTYSINANENGVASLPINLAPGNYEITAVYDNNSITTNITVNPMSYDLVNNSDIVMYYKNGTQYMVTLVDAYGNPVANAAVSVILNGQYFHNLKYSRITNADGVASLPINLAPGNYEITAVYGSVQSTSTVTVLERKDSLMADNIVKYYRNGTQYTVKLLDGNGNPLANQVITLTLNGQNFKNVNYNVLTDENGVASLTINLLAGEYTISAKYGSASITTGITVLPVLVANNLVKAYGKPASFTASIVDGQGMPLPGEKLTFSIKFPSNTISYTMVTNGEGIASLPINLIPGNYKITVTAENGASSTAVVKVVS